jgi:threonylcarbamoyladenosine tRNA methylthiotransferase MtaB
MRRHYDLKYYEGLVHAARTAIPDLAVTTDLLVGFPGEDERRFAETTAFVERLDFAGMHVFRYSPRPGTPAARMAEQVPEQLKAARSEHVRAMAESGQAKFHQRFAGTTQNVLWERAVDDVWHGLTDNYLHAFTKTSVQLHNCVLPSKLMHPYRQGLWAEVEDAVKN